MNLGRWCRNYFSLYDWNDANKFIIRSLRLAPSPDGERKLKWLPSRYLFSLSLGCLRSVGSLLWQVRALVSSLDSEDLSFKDRAQHFHFRCCGCRYSWVQSDIWYEFIGSVMTFIIKKAKNVKHAQNFLLYLVSILLNINSGVDHLISSQKFRFEDDPALVDSITEKVDEI